MSYRGVLAALGWSLGLLVAGVLQQVVVFGELSSDWGSLLETMGIQIRGTPLAGELLRFAGALLLVHGFFGLACWGLAICTTRAFPSLDSRRWWVLFGWLAAGTLWLLAANAALFPWSETGIHGGWSSVTLVANVNLFDLLTVMLLATVALVGVRALMSIPKLRRLLPRLGVYGVLGVGLLAAAGSIQSDALPAMQAKPHIILIGVDSLRNDALAAKTGIGVTPHIDAFLREGAHRFTAASTPLARTYPAWVSILTGKYPRHTGAREDLIARRQLRSFETIADVARRAGYHTVWAMDEMRFSNIDESYGFDQRVSPTIGVADFLLGRANDFPLTNLLANTWVSKKLFPASYGNRAAAHTYRPETFVRWLDDEIRPTQPTLLAVHLTLPHHPYNWSAPTDRIFSRDTDTSYRYLNAVIAADRQFGELLAVLERKGMLQNALVVLLSDHGEALGVPASDSLIRGREVLELLEGKRIALHGHGSSVLSPNQYSVVLALRGFGPAELPMPGREHDEPVSLVDVAPTVAALTGLEAREGFDGLSLRPLLDGDASLAATLNSRVQFTETGFRTPLLDSGKIDEIGLMGQAAPFFHMDPASARLEIRQELLPRLLADKERAAFTADLLLAAMPTGVNGTEHIYVLVDRHTRRATRLRSAPSETTEPAAYALWRAFHDYYGDELLPPRP